MERAPVLIVETDVARGEACAKVLGRLGFSTAVTADWRDIAQNPSAAVLLGADSLGSLADIRRVALDTPILLTCDDARADEAAQLLDIPNLSFVGTGTDLDYALALASLRVVAPASLAEGDAGYALRLAALGEEIARIARAIEPPIAPDAAAPVPDAPMTYGPAVLRATLKARRLRDSLFPSGTFADPTWDMLLDLAASRAEGRPVSVTSLAIAAAVPTSTALRHLKAMAEAGMVVRRPDPDDGRRVYIDLSDDALARMRAWVAGSAKAV